MSQRHSHLIRTVSLEPCSELRRHGHDAVPLCADLAINFNNAGLRRVRQRTVYVERGPVHVAPLKSDKFTTACTNRGSEF